MSVVATLPGDTPSYVAGLSQAPYCSDVTIEVPKNFDADLSMGTVSGKVDTDFQMVLGNSRFDRRNLNGRIGNGGRRLDLNTVSGDVRIKAIN